MGRSRKEEDIKRKKATFTEHDAEKWQEEDAPSLMQIIREQATEEDINPKKNSLSLRKIIGGEILTAEVVRKQIWVVLLITIFLIIYIAEGYSYKKYILEINNLTEQLKDARYKALSVKSDLTEHTRESKIIELLKMNNDSLLQHSDRPVYYIEVPD